MRRSGVQFGLLTSRMRSAVVLGSTVTDLSSGAGGVFTVVHSAMTSAARADGTASASAPAATQSKTFCWFFNLSPDMPLLDFRISLAAGIANTVAQSGPANRPSQCLMTRTGPCATVRAFPEKAESAGDSPAGTNMIQASYWEEASMDGAKPLFSEDSARVL